MPRTRPLVVRPEQQMDDYFRGVMRQYLAKIDSKKRDDLKGLLGVSDRTARGRYTNPERVTLRELRKAAKQMTDDDILNIIRVGKTSKT